jgi:putative heme-binding domain-containing protein
MSERTPVGSTFQTRDLGFAIDSADTWFRPVDIKDGPDGNIYIADWYDGQLAHTANYQGGMDRERGRIYRIRGREPRAKSREPEKTVPVEKGIEWLYLEQSRPQLVHPNRWQRQTALRLLFDDLVRDAAKIKPQSLLLPEINSLDELWAVLASGWVTPDAAAMALAHSDPQVRLWVIRFLAEHGHTGGNTRFVDLAINEKHIEVLCQLACSVRRLKPEQAFPVIRWLLRRSEFIDDPRFPLLVWWALEANVQPARDGVLALFQDESLWREPLVEKEILPRLMRRFAATGQRADLAVCAQLLRQSPTKETTAALMRGFEEAFQGRSLTNVPPELVQALAASGGGSLALRIRQGDQAAIADALQVLADEKAPSNKRVEYATLFGEVKSDAALTVLLDLLTKTSDDAVRVAALTALPAYNDDRIPAAVLSQYQQWTEDVRSVAQSLLVSRKPWSLALVDAVERGDIAATALPLETVRKLTIHRDDRLAAAIQRHWGDVDGASTAEMQAQLEQFTLVLNSGHGDPYPGKKLYMQMCGKCHTLHALGGQVGPDLTTFKRDDVRMLLLNILNPSAEIREGYETHVAITADGRVVQGFLIEQDPQVIVLRGADGQTTSLERDDLDEHVVMKKSLMPEGQLKDLSDQQLRDLFAYLRSAQPLND